MIRNRTPAPATALAQAQHFVDPENRAIVPPIQPATTFARDADYEIGAHVYSRYGSPTLEPAEALIRDLEGGADCLLFASGLAAASAVFEPLVAGDHIVAPKIMYHGLQDWLRILRDRRGLQVTFVDPTDPGAVQAAMRPGQTRMLWVETLSNPTWDVVDLGAMAAIANDAGARFGVDATVTPPISIRPIQHGADIVFHSTTKFLNGHSDVLGGALTTAKEDAAWADIQGVRKYVGGILGPFEAWLLLRGMRTLDVRWQRAQANALQIARQVQAHPAVQRVLYPGLPEHPGHVVAAAQMTGGFGAMMSLLVHGGAEQALAVARAVQCFVPATSLGGVESLIEHRATVEGPESLTPQNLLRLSVGIEAADDLIADLTQALDSIQTGD